MLSLPLFQPNQQTDEALIAERNTPTAGAGQCTRARHHHFVGEGYEAEIRYSINRIRRQ